MAIRTKSAIAAFFESGDKPTQSQFADWIDSCVFIPAAGATGIVEVESTASATTRSLGGFGVQIVGAATTASAQSLIGAPSNADFSSVGRALVSAATTASAQNGLGIGAVGRQLFEAATTAVAQAAIAFSTVSAASSASMEAATDTDVYVTPGRARFHPGVSKAWLKVTGGGTPAISVSHNVSSITDNATGDYTINFTAAFSSEHYAFLSAVRHGPGATSESVRVDGSNAPTASACRVNAYENATKSDNIAEWYAAFFGDQ